MFAFVFLVIWREVAGDRKLQGPPIAIELDEGDAEAGRASIPRPLHMGVGVSVDS